MSNRIKEFIEDEPTSGGVPSTPKVEKPKKSYTWLLYTLYGIVTVAIIFAMIKMFS